MRKHTQISFNYTTPDQSRELIELGIPLWTADCYYENYSAVNPYHDKIKLKLRLTNEECDDKFFENTPLTLPCWSIGNLISIWCICIEDDYRGREKDNARVQHLINNIKYNIKRLDFSKLEDKNMEKVGYNETIVSVELARLLEDAGFDWKEYYVCHSIEEPFHWEIPLYIAQKWLREVKCQFLYVEPLSHDDYSITYVAKKLNGFTTREYDTYEEALEDGIFKCITLIL